MPYGQKSKTDTFILTLPLITNSHLQGYDKEAIDKDFQQFMKLNNEAKERLQNSHEWLPSSVGF